MAVGGGGVFGGWGRAVMWVLGRGGATSRSNSGPKTYSVGFYKTVLRHKFAGQVPESVSVFANQFFTVYTRRAGNG